MFDEHNAPKKLTPDFPKLGKELPLLLIKIVKELALQYQVDENTVFSIALGCWASSTRGRFQVQVTQDWIEPTTLYICTIAETADGKSQVMKLLSKPIREAEELAQAEIRELNNIQAHRFEIAEAQLEQVKKSLSNPKKVKSLPASDADLIAALQEVERQRPKPLPIYLVGGDVTPDRLIEMLQEHGALSIMEAEGILFQHLSGKKHNTGSSWEGLLAAKTGDPIKSHRIGRGDGYVANPRLNISVAVQPDVWRELHQDRAATQRGVTGRFLPIVARSMVGYRSIRAATEHPISQVLMEAWRDKSKEMLAISEERTLNLHPDALDYFQEWRERWEGELIDEENRLNGFGNRLPGNLITIAALFTLMDDPHASEIPLEALQMACGLDQYFLKHRKLADSFQVERTPAQRVLAKIVSVIKKGGDIGDAFSGSENPNLYYFTTRDLQQSMKQQSWVKHGGTEALKAALQDLERMGWIYEGADDGHWIASRSLIQKYHRQ
jgi:hypothetical protein